MEKQTEISHKVAHRKVGILTFHWADNYGAVLQAYSLQAAVSAFGYDVSIINYNPHGKNVSDGIFRRYYAGFAKNLLCNILLIPNYFKLLKRKKKFSQFRSIFFNLTPGAYSVKDILEFEDWSDMISGSDQVFNIDVNVAPSVYYLPFTKTGLNKIAYAPSFGFSEFSDEIDNKIVGPLSSFDFLSCRETDGARHISELTDRECHVVLDPVLLNTQDFWVNMCKEPNVGSDYILIYDLLGGQNLVTLAHKIREEKNKKLKIVCVTTKKFLKHSYDVDQIIWDAGPEEFVGFFKKAAYVVTDSFHGCAFALLFNKPLVSLIVSERAKARLLTLLRKVRSEDKIIPKDSVIKDLQINDYIIRDYETAVLEGERNSSLSYLYTALKK